MATVTKSLNGICWFHAAMAKTNIVLALCVLALCVVTPCMCHSYRLFQNWLKNDKVNYYLLRAKNLYKGECCLFFNSKGKQADTLG